MVISIWRGFDERVNFNCPGIIASSEGQPVVPAFHKHFGRADLGNTPRRDAGAWDCRGFYPVNGPPPRSCAGSATR